MSNVISPDAYRLASSHRRSGPDVQAYNSMSLDDPRLADFLRGGAATASGKVVTERSALRNATFFRAINLICGCVGMLPTNLFHKLPSGDTAKADSHPVQRLLRKRPNSWQTPLQFKAHMQGRALMRGNAYAFKVPGARGVQALVPMDPCRVRPELQDDFTLLYRWTPKNGSERVLTQKEVFHLRAPFSSDGISGDALLEVAAEALGLAQAADEAAGSLLKNGTYLGGKLKHPKSLSKEATLRLKDQFEERYSGSGNAGKWIMLEEGLDAEPLGMTGQQAQGLEQRKHQAEEVSRFTGVPRPLLMFDETSWGSGIEQLGLFLITYCLLPWFQAWEEVIAQSLLTEAEQETHYAKFNEAALLRGSLKDQAEFLAKALGGPGAAGWMVPNEARDKMDMNQESWGNAPAWIANGGTANAE